MCFSREPVTFNNSIDVRIIDISYLCISLTAIYKFSKSSSPFKKESQSLNIATIMMNHLPQTLTNSSTRYGLSTNGE